MHATSIAFFLVLVLLPLGTPEDETRSAEAEAAASPLEPRIEAVRTDPVRVAYLQHAGPYWTVGPILARVREYMREHDEPGPAYVRFSVTASNPAGEKAGGEVGFFTQRDKVVGAPFKTADRGPELAATMSVSGALASPARYYPVLRRWAEENGYLPLGAVTEIYRIDLDGALRGDEVQVQIVMRANSDKTGSERPHERDVATREDSNPGAVPNAAATRKDGRIQAAGYHEAGGGNEAPDSPAGPAGAVTKVEPIKKMFFESRFREIAEQLMPARRPLPRDERPWLGQVVLRIGAVARGVRQVYPDDKSLIPVLAEAIRARYDEVSKDFAFDPRSDPVTRIGPAKGPRAVERLAIMHDLDSLLGGIAVKRLDSDATEARLLGIIERVRNLLGEVNATSQQPTR